MLEPEDLFLTNHSSGLEVKMSPAVATEGQRVTLTCSTSCPLSDSVYIWSFNGRPLMLPENQSKHLVLDPVSGQHDGNYSCSVRSGTRNVSSSEVKVTVLRVRGEPVVAAAAGLGAALLLVTALSVFCWIR